MGYVAIHLLKYRRQRGISLVLVLFMAKWQTVDAFLAIYLQLALISYVEVSIAVLIIYARWVVKLDISI